MDFSPVQLHNPWEDPASLPSLPSRFGIPSLILVFLSCFSLPFLGNGFAALGVFVLGLLALIWFCRRLFPILLTSLFSLLLLFLFGSVASVFLALSLAVAGSVLWFTLSKHPPLVFLCPLGAALAAGLILSDLSLALTSLFPIPAILALSYAVTRGKHRSMLISFAALGFFLSLLIALLFSAFRNYGTLNRDLILQFFADARSEFSASLFEIRDGMIAFYEEISSDFESNPALASQYAQIIASLRSAFPDETLVNLTASVFNLLPGIALAFCLILGYFSQLLLNAFYRTAGCESVVTLPSRILVLSFPTAILFTLAYLVSGFSDPLTMVGAVFGNLTVILLPGFFAVGIRMILLQFSASRGGFRAFFVILMVAAVCCLGTAVQLIALWASCATVFFYFRLFLHTRGGGNGENGGSKQ